METYFLNIGFEDNDFMSHLIMAEIQKGVHSFSFIDLSPKVSDSKYRYLKLVLEADWAKLYATCQQLEKNVLIRSMELMDVSSNDTPTLCGYYSKQKLVTKFYRDLALVA
jgi:hypothetical protein